MDDNEVITLIALLVSLLALLIAVGQLGQQLFSAAEGSRRCTEAIIGPWSRLTHRHPIVSELRIEFQFYTPEIALPRHGETTHADGDGPFFLNEEHLPGEVQEAWQIPQPRQIADEEWRITQDQSSRYRFKERSDLGRMLTPRRAKSQPGSYGSKKDLMITWNELLRLAYRHQKHRDTDLTQLDQVKDQSSPSFSEAIIYLRMRSWDLIPPDVVRPLASTTLGDIVILAQRLGMTWRDLRPTEGFMRAEGKGVTLFSPSGPIRGLGTVLQFNSMRSRSGPERLENPLIPSAESDKLLCGVIPGSRRLGIGDLDIIGDDRKLHLSGAMEKLGISTDVQRNLAQLESETYYRCPINDILYLTCDFVPLKGSPIGRIFHPMPASRYLSFYFQATPLHFWEGRVALLLHLESIVGQTLSNPLRKMHAYLQEMRTDFEDDFFCRWRRSRLRPAVNLLPPRERMAALQDAVSMLNRLRDIYNATTEYFFDLEADGQTVDSLRVMDPAPVDNEKYRTSSLKFTYRDFVAAHVTMAIDAVRKAAQSHANTQAREAVRKEVGHLNEGQMVDIAHQYIDGLPGLVKNMHERGCQLSEDQIHEAWWVLVVRGIAWGMSVWLENPGEGTHVPSSFYDSQMPIWIM